MTFEAFQQLVSVLKKDSDKSLRFYKLGLEDYSLKEELYEANTIMTKAHYSEVGDEILGWWIWEGGDKFIYDNGGNKTNDLTKIEDLWKYLEEIRKSPDFEEYVPKKKKPKTKKQIEKVFGQFFNTKTQ